jgi:hypothetical protein
MEKEIQNSASLFEEKLHRGLLRRPACCEELDTAASTFIGSIAVVGEESCVSMNQSCRLEELNPAPKCQT